MIAERVQSQSTVALVLDNLANRVVIDDIFCEDAYFIYKGAVQYSAEENCCTKRHLDNLERLTQMYVEFLRAFS